MKHGYICKCGWRLKRGELSRRQYAAAKIKHAEHCEFLAKELAQSKKVSMK